MADLATIGLRADFTQIKQADRALSDLAKTGGNAERQVTRATDSMNSSFAGLTATVGILGTALAGLTTGVLAKYADTATKVENQLKVVTNSTAELASAQERLGRVANDSRAGYEATVGLYSKLARSTEGLNISSERLFKITETINKSFAVSGASAQEADSAIRQLGQGLASGALRGDEFNSVAEQAPEILRAVAKETGMSVGALREFAAQGGITADLLIKSLESYGATVDSIFATATATIEQSLTVANNNAIKFVESNELIRAGAAAVGGAIQTASEHLDEMAEAAQAAATVVGVYMVGALARSAVGFTTATVQALAYQAALARMAGASATAAVATTALGTATRFLLGPWGLLVTAVGAAATVFAMSNDKISESVPAVKDLSSEIDALTGSIDKMSEAQRKSLALKIEDQLASIKARKEALLFSTALRESLTGFSETEISEFGEFIGVAGINMKTLSAAATYGRAEIDTLDARTAELNGTMDRLAKVSTKSATAIASVGMSAKDSAKRMAELDEKMGDWFDGDEEIAEITKDRIAQKEEEAEAWFKWREAVDETTDSVVNLSEEAGKRIEQAFADVWLNAFDGMNSMVDGMKNAFKRMLAEMAHMALTKPILLQIGNALPSGGIADIFKAQGAGAGDMSGMLGKTGIMSTIAAYAGPMAIVASLGSMLSKALGGTGTNGALFGGIGGALLGDWKTESSNLNLGFSGGNVDGSTTTTNVKKKFFKNRRETFTDDFDTSVINSAFDAIEQSLISAASMLGVTGAEEILNGFTASLNLNLKDMTEEQVAAAIQEWVGATTEGMIEAVFGDAAEGLGKAGESAIDTLMRVTANFESVKSVAGALGLNFELTGKAGLAAATNIVELVGGLDRLSAVSTQYYQEFYSDAERQAKLQSDLSSAMDKLGLSMVNTHAEFRAQVEALDLTTEAGQATYAALMNLVPGMSEYLSALNAQESATKAAAEAAQKEAEAKADALAKAGSDLELRLMDALGQSSEALAKRREMELAATDESLRGLLMSIYAAEDAAVAQRELASAQESAARSAEQLKASLIDAAQGAFSRLEQSVGAEKEKAGQVLELKLSAIDAEREALSSAHQATMAGYAAQESAVSSLIDKLGGLSGVINDFLGSGSQAVDPFKRLTQILTEASVGMLPDQSELSSVLGSINSRGSQGFGSATEMNLAMARARSQAGQLGGIVGSRMTDAQRQLASIDGLRASSEAYFQSEMDKLATAELLATEQHDEQVSKLDEQLSEAQKQLDALLGIDNTILSVDEAMKRFNEALVAATTADAIGVAEQVTAINNVTAAVYSIPAMLAAIIPPPPPATPINLAPPQDSIGEPVTREMVDLLKELVAGNESIAKHTKTSADALEFAQYETLEANP